MDADVLIVGGGIAGLSAALLLARSGRRVRVLEREARPFGHASGRNAAIFRHAEPSADLVRLARRSKTLLDDIAGEGWLDARDALYLARDPHALAQLEGAMREADAPFEHLEGDALRRLLPAGLGDTDVRAGLRSLADGVIQLDVVRDALVRGLAEAGATLSLETDVEALLVDDGRARGVRLSSGQLLRADAVVLAAGAFAEGLAADAGLPLGLVAVRRHLFLLDVLEGAPDERRWPVMWRLEDEIYLRGDPEGLVASPCDEEAWPPSLPPVDEGAWPALEARLASFAPDLAPRAVRRGWACLRTRAADGGLVVGEDPRAAGLFWLAGLAGWGMTVGVAAAELLVAAVSGGPRPPTGFLPDRLLARAPSRRREER